jgi:hypothetical protein
VRLNIVALFGSDPRFDRPALNLLRLYTDRVALALRLLLRLPRLAAVLVGPDGHQHLLIGTLIVAVVGCPGMKVSVPVFA